MAAIQALEAAGPDGAAARRLSHGEDLGEGTPPSGKSDSRQISASLPGEMRSLGQVGRSLDCCYLERGFVITGQTQSSGFDKVTGPKPGKEGPFLDSSIAPDF